LVEGVFKGGVFYAKFVGFPPAEERSTTTELYGPLEFVPELTYQENEEFLLEMEAGFEEYFVIISELHLDNPHIMQKFKSMLNQIEDHSPFAFILMGSFVSRPLYSDNNEFSRYKGKFAFDILERSVWRIRRVGKPVPAHCKK
jgi:DNA polymerase epsilon subunit 2